VSKEPKQKVYHGVLEEIRNYIREHQLFPGDKLPSERDLAEKLQAGRSSVREALRALELLGLIETRRGEGTYLRTYQSLQSAELLSSFILLEDRTKKDLLQTKQLIEKEAAKLAFPKMDESCLSELKECISIDVHPEERHARFYNFLFTKADNQLLFKIWTLIEEFSLSIYKSDYELALYEGLVEIFSKKDFSAIEAFHDFQHQSSSED